VCTSIYLALEQYLKETNDDSIDAAYTVRTLEEDLLEQADEVDAIMELADEYLVTFNKESNIVDNPYMQGEGVHSDLSYVVSQQ